MCSTSSGARTARGRTGTLIIIGGHEDKRDEALILKEVAKRIDSGKLVVATVASALPEAMCDDYQRVFRRLGVKHLYRLDVLSHDDACSESKQRILADADGVFFTGGDQLKITSPIGASPICERLREIYHGGGGPCPVDVRYAARHTQPGPRLRPREA